jgi:hypothetical protein
MDRFLPFRTSVLSDDSQVTFTNVPGLLEAIKGLNRL